MTSAQLRRTEANLQRAYPERAAGGFSRVDGTIQFYTRITALCQPHMTVLDLGAGRGHQILDAPTEFHRELLKIQNKVKKLVGVDVDPVVKDNPFIDESQVITADARMPFADETFDLIYADWVLEHVSTPEKLSSEVHRLLKSGGWFCARTPNRWGLTGLVTNLVPSRHHAKIVSRLQPGRKEIDVFPTFYRLNTMEAIRTHFPHDLWTNMSYYYNAEPPYVHTSSLLINIARLYFKLQPPFLSTNIFVFLRKVA